MRMTARTPQGGALAELPHEVAVEVKDFRAAMRTFARKKRMLGATLLSVEHGYLIIESGDVRVVMKATGEWHGRVRFSPEVLKAIATVPPSENPVRVSYADGRVRIGTMAIPCSWESVSAVFMKQVTSPALLDLLAMGRNLPRTGLAGSALAERIKEAETERDRRIRRAVATLSELGVGEAVIRGLVDEAVQGCIVRNGGAWSS